MKLVKRWAPLAAAILSLALILGCDGKAKPVKREAGKTYELVLLHTNDHHGSLLPNGGRGGVAERAAFVKSVRAANDNVLLVDAGDINTGTALSNMFYAEPDFLAYNLIGYDAATFGNHEFDGTPSKLDAQLDLAEFPFVSSNIKTADGKFLGSGQYLVKDYDGFRVGIIGITTLRTRLVAQPDKSLSFLPEIKAASDAVDALRNKEKVDIVIALTHLGDVSEDDNHITAPLLAAAVPGIDIIVDGHSHSFMESPQRIGNTYLVSANEWGKYVGQGKLAVVDGKLVKFDWKPVEINTRDKQTYTPDAETSALLAPYLEKAETWLKEVVAQLPEAYIFGNRLPRYEETAIGDMIADGNVWYFKTVFNQDIDFAFQNGGNIRAELPEGPLTREQILTVLPFENYLYIASLRGDQIIELFNYIGTIPQGNGGFPQFSKEVRYTLDIPHKQVQNLTIGGAPVDPQKMYRFCTNDYLFGGGDGYTVLTKAADRFNTSLLLSFVTIEYINAHKDLKPALDGRLTVIGGVKP